METSAAEAEPNIRNILRPPMIASVQRITSLDLPELEPFKTLRRPIEHLEQGIFVAEGEKVTVRLLESGLKVHSLLMSDDWFTKYDQMIRSHNDEISVFIGEKKLLETIVGHVLHQSIMGLASVPPPLSSADLTGGMLSAGSENDGPLHFVLVDGITNAENMGVIVRNCACFNVKALLVLPTSCDPYLRRSVRNSMGNIFRLPIVYLHDAERDMKELKNYGVRFYAAHPHEKSSDIREVTFSERSCLVLGAEGHGIADQVLNLCDEFVSIPMKEGVDSLNVASASAVLLYEMNGRND